MIRAVEKLGLLAKAFLMRGWEARHAARFDRCLVVSEIEAQRLRAVAAGTAVSLVPNGVDTTALRPLPEAAAGNRLIFVGHLRYPPNVDAVRFLGRHILPALRARIPEARLTVVGEGTPRVLREFAGRDDIELVGRASSPIPYYRDAHVAVVPLRAGGGTRLKSLEAMALGRPVVSTQFGCEGLAVENGKHLLIADDAEELADALERALDDIPNFYAAWHKAVEGGDGGPWIPVGENLSPLEALSGENKPDIKEFIAFCRQGAFEIR